MRGATAPTRRAGSIHARCGTAPVPRNARSRGVTMEGQSTPIPSASPPGRVGRLGRLAHFTTRYRWPVIGTWIVLTLFGGYAAGQLSSRWYQSLAVPGEPAYEASQRTFAALGAGVRSPNTVVFHSSGADLGTSRAVRAATE